MYIWGDASPLAKYPLLPEALLDYQASFLGSAYSSNATPPPNCPALALSNMFRVPPADQDPLEGARVQTTLHWVRHVVGTQLPRGARTETKTQTAH